VADEKAVKMTVAKAMIGKTARKIMVCSLRLKLGFEIVDPRRCGA